MNRFCSSVFSFLATRSRFCLIYPQFNERHPATSAQFVLSSADDTMAILFNLFPLERTTLNRFYSTILSSSSVTRCREDILNRIYPLYRRGREDN